LTTNAPQGERRSLATSVQHKMCQGNGAEPGGKPSGINDASRNRMDIGSQASVIVCVVITTKCTMPSD